ncbi:MAG: hypothetical protein VXW58_06120, partial [Pseudomonadota bacterium]|nr:hypothetical protein [Pseudomonadota bacterium]
RVDIAHASHLSEGLPSGRRRVCLFRARLRQPNRHGGQISVSLAKALGKYLPLEFSGLPGASQVMTYIKRRQCLIFGFALLLSRPIAAISKDRSPWI